MVVRTYSCLIALVLVLVAPAGARAQPDTQPADKRPATMSEADGKIATEIEHRLSRDPEVNASAVELDVRDGVVAMSGRVASEATKERAEKIAAGVPGITRVRNLLTVGTAAGPAAPGAPGPIPERMPGHE